MIQNKSTPLFSQTSGPGSPEVQKFTPASTNPAARFMQRLSWRFVLDKVVEKTRGKEIDRKVPDLIDNDLQQKIKEAAEKVRRLWR